MSKTPNYVTDAEAEDWARLATQAPEALDVQIIAIRHRDTRAALLEHNAEQVDTFSHQELVRHYQRGLALAAQIRGR